MPDCKKCGGSVKDEALYCVHCGARLDSKACRRCGNYVPDDAKYCEHCGYITSGSVCGKCGAVSPEGTNFCPTCGNKLSAQVEAVRRVEPAEYRAAAVPSVKAAKSGNESVKMKAYKITRAFVLPLLLMCLFISSFFGMFTVEMPEMDDDFNASVSGFDAVRGMFLLIDPPTLEERLEQFSEFCEKEGYSEKIAKAEFPNTQKRLTEKAMSEFGPVRFYTFDENMNSAWVMKVLVWGLTSLSLMALTFVFFILSLIHAIYMTLGKRDGFYKFETLPLALITAITFSFIMTGSIFAGAAIAMIILGVLGLGAVTSVKYYVDKVPRANIATNLRRGICAALVVVVAILSTNVLMTVGYNGTGVRVDYKAEDLYNGMYNTVDEAYGLIFDISGVDVSEINLNAVDIDKEVKEVIESAGASNSDKEEYISYLSPFIITFTSEAEDVFAAPEMAVSWLLFFANIFFAAMVTMSLYTMLQEEANPEKSNDKYKRRMLLWSILSFAGSAAILGFTIPQVVMSNSIAKDLSLGSNYSISGIIIAGVVMAAVSLVTYAIMSKFENGTKKKDEIEMPDSYSPQQLQTPDNAQTDAVSASDNSEQLSQV